MPEKRASDLLHSTGASKNILFWAPRGQLLRNKHTIPVANIAELVEYMLFPHNNEVTKPRALNTFLDNNIFANTYAMNAISGNLVSKISDHLPQFLIVDTLKVNYKILNYYKNDFSKFDEEKFINDF